MSSTPDASTAIGIDLGTTYCCVGVWDNHTRTVKIFESEEGGRTVPSWVAFEQGERLIGEPAKTYGSTNGQNAVNNIKRLMGRRYADREVQQTIAQVGYRIVQDNLGYPMVELDISSDPDTPNRRRFKPEEISAMLLGKMKSIAESHLGHKVTKAVITVPAYFDDTQRVATQNAAKIAGLECLRIINEPTSACLCYGLNEKSKAKVLVFDLGGGTFDVSILEVTGEIFKVVAINGDTHLGGVDFDNAIYNYLLGLCPDHVKEDDRSTDLIRSSAERAKKELSSKNQTRIDIPNLNGGFALRTSLSRSAFESMCEPIFRRCMIPVETAIRDAGLTPSELEQMEIVLVGGSTRIPKIQEMLSKKFGGKPLCKSINPDEAVAYGAAVQAAILSKTDRTGRTAGIVLLDAIPLSLGVETRGGKMAKIIEKHTTIPCTMSQRFTTAENNQNTIKVKIYQGERTFVDDNHYVGEFQLSGIPPMPQGIPKIEISFSMDSNGVLSVTATEETTAITQTVTVSRDSGRLTEEQISQMLEDAEKFTASDEVRAELIEIKNSFERYLHKSQNTLNDSDMADAISLEERSRANQMILQTYDWLTAIDPRTGRQVEYSKDDLYDCKSALDRELKPIINKIYAYQLSSNVKPSDHETPISEDNIDEINALVNNIL